MRILAPLFLAPALAGAADLPAPDCALVSGWTQEGPSRAFEPDTLFDYMDGNAEGYLAYGFVSMRGVTCVNDAADQLVIDVSELRDTDSAWGIFVVNRDIRSPSERIGVVGQVLPRRATFVKDRYYVEIAASPAGDYTEPLRAFTTALAARIHGVTTPPEELAWFPRDGLETDSARFVPEGVLGIRPLRRAFVAEYPGGRAFVATEDSPVAAAETLRRVRARLSNTSDVAGIGDAAFSATDETLGGLLVWRKGPHVAGVVDLAPGRDGRGLARRLADALP